MALIFFQGCVDCENLNLSALDFQGLLGPQMFTTPPPNHLLKDFIYFVTFLRYQFRLFCMVNVVRCCFPEIHVVLKVG